METIRDVWRRLEEEEEEEEADFERRSERGPHRKEEARKFNTFRTRRMRPTTRGVKDEDEETSELPTVAAPSSRTGKNFRYGARPPVVET